MSNKQFDNYFTKKKVIDPKNCKFSLKITAATEKENLKKTRTVYIIIIKTF